jgi:hypothetical protein
MHPRPTNGDPLKDYPVKTGNAIDALDRRLKGNLLINGAFQVWQRGTTIAVGAARTYTADAWVAYRSGFALGATVSRQAGDQAQYCARVQRDVGNASAAPISFVHQIETVDCTPFQGRYVKVGFRARKGADYSAAGSNLSVVINTGTGTDEANDFAYTGLVSTAEQKVLTANFQDFEAAPLLVPANATEMAVSFQFTPPAVAAGANDYFELEESQQVPGEYVGLFPYLPFADELRLCQRRYCKSFAYGTAPAQNAGTAGAPQFVQAVGAAAATHVGFIPFPVRMRIAPAITVYNPSAANAQARNISSGADCSATGTDSASETGFAVNATSAAGSAAGQRNAIHFQATADI